MIVLTSTNGAVLTDDDVERRLRWANVDCVDSDSIDQGDLLAFSEGPVRAEVAETIRQHLELCEYCRALSAEYRRISNERRRKRNFLKVTGAASVAAAAGIIATLLIPGPKGEQGVREYELALLHGTIAGTMAAPEKSEVPELPWHFAPSSPIELVLRPREENAVGRVPLSAVYRAMPGGALERVQNVRLEPNNDAVFPVLTLNATGEKVFGDGASGARTLIVVLAVDAETLSSIEGQTIERAKTSATGRAQFFAYSVIYEN